MGSERGRGRSRAKRRNEDKPGGRTSESDNVTANRERARGPVAGRGTSRQRPARKDDSIGRRAGGRRLRDSQRREMRWKIAQTRWTEVARAVVQPYGEDLVRQRRRDDDVEIMIAVDILGHD